MRSQKAIEKEPSLTSLKGSETDSDEISKAKDLYKNVLMREIVEILFLTCGWKTQITRSNLLNGQSISFSAPPDMSEVIQLRWNDLSFDKTENDLFYIDSSKFIHGFYVPQGTRVKLLKDKISILNPFVNIDISVRPYQGSLGMGVLKYMSKISEFENLKYWQQTYRITLVVNFNTYKSGHPKMKDYKDWIDKIFKEFSLSFDSQKHLEKAKEDYNFYKDIDTDSTESIKEAHIKHGEWFQKLKKNNMNQPKAQEEHQ